MGCGRRVSTTDSSPRSLRSLSTFFKEFSSHILKVFLPHTLPKPLQSHPTAVFREEIIIVRFQVSKRRRSPEGSRAAERSKINVHVFSPSGGLRRGLRESLPAELNPERIFKSRFPSHPSPAPHAIPPPRVFRSSSSSLKLFKIKLHLLV